MIEKFITKEIKGMLRTRNFVTLALAFLLFLLLVDNDKTSVHASDYCSASASKEICPRGLTHFTCYKNEILPSKGKFMAHVPFTNKIIRTLLEGHNEIRDSVASGRVTAHFTNRVAQIFPRAARMRELVWDHELAYLARQQAGQCNSFESVCHNSKRHPHSAQNLNVVYDDQKVKIAKVIHSSFKKWFDHRDNVKDVNKMVSGKQLYPIARELSVIVNEHTSHVGCAISYCTKCEVRSERKPTTWQQDIDSKQRDPAHVKFLQDYWGPKHKSNKKSDLEQPVHSSLVFVPGIINAEHCYYLICNYNTELVAHADLYHTTDDKPPNQCHVWNTTESTKYRSLCANTGEIFEQPNLPPYN